MSMKHRHQLFVLAAVLVGCAGCSSSSNDAADVAAVAATVTTDVTSEGFGDPLSRPETPASIGELRRSPIEAALDIETDPVKLSVRWAEVNRAFRDAVEECMTNQGFREYRTMDFGAPSPEDFRPRAPEDDLRQYGYGPTLRARGQLFGIKPADPSLATEEDIVATYIEDMSGEELEAFFTQLASCESAADAQHPNGGDDLPLRIADEVYALREDAEQSVEVLAAWDSWSDCMFDAGFRFRDRRDAAAAAEEIMEPAFAYLADLIENRKTVSLEVEMEFEAILTPLADQEQLIVDSDLQCSESVRLQETIDTSIWNAESEWLAANGDRLALLLAESG